MVFALIVYSDFVLCPKKRRLMEPPDMVAGPGFEPGTSRL